MTNEEAAAWYAAQPAGEPAMCAIVNHDAEEIEEIDISAYITNDAPFQGDEIEEGSPVLHKKW